MKSEFGLVKKVIKAAAEFEAEASANEARMKEDLKRAQALGFAKADHELSPQERFERNAKIAMEANGQAAGHAVTKLVLPAILKIT